MTLRAKKLRSMLRVTPGMFPGVARSEGVNEVVKLTTCEGDEEKIKQTDKKKNEINNGTSRLLDYFRVD